MTDGPMTDGPVTDGPVTGRPGRDLTVWWLVGLTALALVVRVIGLDSGLWADEIDSLVSSFRPPLADIVLTFPRDNRHPFYSVLAHLAMAVFGEHNWVIRLPAVLFGAATVPLLYLLGTRIVGRREALLAAAFLAVSYHHVWFSQNARGYALLGTSAVLSAWLLLRCLDDPRKRFMVGYGLTIALGAWTHLTMVFVAAGHGAACALLFLLGRPARTDAAWRRLAGAIALAALFTLLLYAPVLGDVTHYFANKPSGLKGVSTPSWAIAEGVRVLLAGLGGAGAAAALTALAVGGTVFGAGLLALWRTQPLALGMFVLPGVVTIAGAAVARGTMYPRFFFSMAPYGVLIAVAGAFALAAALGPRLGLARASATRVAGALVGLLIVVSALSLGRVWRYPKQDYVGAFRWAEAQRAPGDTIATVDLTAGLNRQYFHLPYAEVTDSAGLARLRAGGRVLLVYVFPRYLAHGAPEVHAVTERECGEAAEFRGTVGGGDVYVCTLEARP